MTTIAKRSLAGGEIAPAIHARTDIVKFQTGLRTCRGFIIRKQGGAANRPGTTFICEVKDSSKRVRLVPFVFNAEQTYALEIGDEYMRVIREAARVAVSGVTAWSNATAYVIGDLASRLGVNYYCILAHTNQQPPNATYWYPLTGSIYELPAPYDEADLQEFHHFQSNDVITVTHQLYAIREVQRYGHTRWVISAPTFAPTQAAPTSPTNTASGAGGDKWVITAVNSETFEESLASAVTEANATASSGSPITVSWAAASGAIEYNVYKLKNGIYGLVGIAGGTSFVDNGINADTTETPPTARNPFSGSGNFPATGTYYQQRLGFANTTNKPEVGDFSRSGQFKNFTKSSPLQDDDAVTFNLAGRQSNAIQHMIELDQLICLTAGAEVIIQGDEAGTLLPGEVNPSKKSYDGAAAMPQPIVTGSVALFVQARGSIVRDLLNDAVEGYKGNDLTTFAAHLFSGHTIVDWAYQKTPDSIIWAVRDDGILLGFTYIREHQIWAWHRHDFDGGDAIVENVCAIPEGNEDALYLVIRRVINGQTKRYIEKLNTRDFTDIKDAIFMDSALTYDGRNTNGAHTMTLTGSGWTNDDILTLTSSTGFFVSGDVGNEIHLEDSDGNLVRLEITQYDSTTVVQVRPDRNVPVSMRAQALSTWGKAVDEISGLSHIEGRQVSVLGDGFVVASPNNDEYEVLTVTSGAITLERPYVVVHVGLPIIADVETLNIDTVDGEPIADKRQLIQQVTMMVEASRGIFAGSRPPTDDDDDPLEGLNEYKARDAESMDEPVALTTDNIDIKIESGWNSNGRVFVRQVDPLPLTILSVMPSGMIPLRG